MSGNPARRSDPRSSERHAGADPGLRELFVAARDLIDAAHGAVEATVVRTPLNRFDIAQLVRGINGVKAAQLLMESSHWEFASGVARQLFEQLVNMEFLATRPDRTAAVESYAKFGLMQAIREQVVELEYLERTGRRVDLPHLNFLRGLLESDFDEFKGKPKADGSINFKGSWSGKPVSQLVTESKNVMRVQQYESLYRGWSAEVHAAPKAMLDDLLRSHTLTLDDVIKNDVEEIAQLMASTLNLFLDLWSVLPHVKQLSLQEKLAWLARLRTELGRVVDLSSYRPPAL